jgi:hypothetical protein
MAEMETFLCPPLAKEGRRGFGNRWSIFAELH